jgi:hypothetical protein
MAEKPLWRTMLRIPAPPAPSGLAAPVSAATAPAAKARPWYKRKRFAIPLGAVVMITGLGILGANVDPPKKTYQSAATTPPRRQPTTTAPRSTTSEQVTAPTTTTPAGVTVTPFTEVQGDRHPSARDVEAFDICQQLVTTNLTAPLGAVWRNPRGDQVTYRGAADGSGPVYVNSTVDSKNAFGTMVRSHYTCSVIYDGNHKWHMDDLQLDGPGF